MPIKYSIQIFEVGCLNRFIDKSWKSEAREMEIFVRSSVRRIFYSIWDLSGCICCKDPIHHYSTSTCWDRKELHAQVHVPQVEQQGDHFFIYISADLLKEMLEVSISVKKPYHPPLTLQKIKFFPSHSMQIFTQAPIFALVLSLLHYLLS